MRGATHGLLRYLHPNSDMRRSIAERPQSELLFNYLGSIDDLLPPDSLFAWASESAPRGRSAAGPRAYRIEINARIEERCLTFDIEYSSALHHAWSIAGFADAIRDAFGAISAGSSAPPSPFELSGLDEVGLDRVTDLLAEMDDE